MVAPMNYIKKFIILLVTSSIILSNTLNVNADVRILTPQEELQFYRDLYNESVTEGGYQSWLKRLSKKVFDNVGFLIDESGILIQKIKDAIHGADPDMPSDMTDEEAYDWVKSNLTVSDNIVANDSFNTFVKNYETTYVNDNKINLFYACDLQASQQYISTTGLEDIINIMDDHPNCYYILSRPIRTLYLWAIPIGSDKIYGVVRSVYSSDWSLIDLYRCKNIGGVLSVDPISNQDESNYIYEYDGTNFNLVSDNTSISAANANSGAYFNVNKKASTDGNDWSTYPKALTKNDQSIQVFTSSTALNTYINNTTLFLYPYY